MFKGLHSTLQKTRTVDTLSKHPDVYPVHTAEVLLSPEKRQQHIRKIKGLLNLPPKLYESLYHTVIQQFAEFAQNLPETQYGLFANEGGFLDHGLERAARALSLCLNYFFPQEKTFQAVSPQEALWLYAVFTAALFLDIGKIGVKFEVEICSKDGATIKTWLPYSGSLIAEQAKFYRFNYIKRNLDNLKKLITGLIARQILDKTSNNSNSSGFNWIASNNDVLETWLTILQGERRLPMTSFMSMIPLAEAQIIEQFLNREDLPPPIITLPLDAEKDKDQAKKQNLELGEDFLKWVRDKIATEVVIPNQENSDIHQVEEGVLLDPKLFEQFIKETNKSYSQAVDPGSVEQQFRQLVEAFWDAPATIQQRHVLIKGIASQQLHRFVLIANPALLYVAGSAYQANINNISPFIAKAPPTQNTTLPQQPPRVENQTQRPNLTFNI